MLHPDFKSILVEIMRNRSYSFSPFLFICHESRHKHKRYTKEIINARWNAAAKSVGVDIDLYHGTRHTTITKYANELMPEQTRLLAGHTSVQTTMTYYGKVNIETERDLLAGKVLILKKFAPNSPLENGKKR